MRFYLFIVTAGFVIMWKSRQLNKTTRKRWYMFTSDSDHLHRIRTAIQSAENARTLWDERVPTLAIFARLRTHRTGPDSYAAFPKTKPDPIDCWKKNTQTFQQPTRLQHFCLIKNQLYEIKGLFLDFIIITESNNYFVITCANIPKTTMQNCFVGNLRWKRSVDHWIRIPSSALVEWLNTYVRPLCVKNPLSVKALICKKANISTFRYLAFIMLCV